MRRWRQWTIRRFPPPLLLSEQTSRGVEYQHILEWGKSESKYDLIILRHVLEHSPHPVKLMAQLASRLTDRGMIFVEVPNLEAGMARLLGRLWKAYYVPRHIYHYTRRSLAAIAREAGLVPQIGTAEMPIVGNTIAILTGWNQSNPLVQVAGGLLHPIQLLIGAVSGNPQCLTARCRLKPAEGKA